MKEIIPVQIIGTQRSGSNLLRLMLNQLNHVFAPHPPHILSTFNPIISAYGDLTNDHNFKVLINDVCQLVELNPVAWDQLIADRELIFESCQYRSLVEVFRKMYELNAQHHQAKVWVCKSMQNVKYITYFRQISLHPKIIYLYRDGRDVAVSFKKTIVGPKHIYALAHKWNEEQLLSLQYISQRAEVESLAVSYESLIAQPEEEMKRICTFLGLPYQPEFINFYTSEESRKTAEAGEMWTNLVCPLMHQNINKFKQQLSEEEITIFESVAKEALVQLGYALQTNTPYPDFSQQQIEDYQKANVQMMNLAQQHANKSDMEKRFAQNHFIQELKERFRKHSV